MAPYEVDTNIICKLVIFAESSIIDSAVAQQSDHLPEQCQGRGGEGQGRGGRGQGRGGRGQGRGGRGQGRGGKGREGRKSEYPNQPPS